MFSFSALIEEMGFLFDFIHCPLRWSQLYEETLYNILAFQNIQRLFMFSL